MNSVALEIIPIGGDMVFEKDCVVFVGVVQATDSANMKRNTQKGR